MREDGFRWCGHCGEPHPLSETVCPVTGRPLDTTLHRSSAAPPHQMIGRVIDKKYRIRAVLGQGGMGTVFEAEHLLLQRSVALKLIRPTTSDPKRAMKRMQHEARIAGAIGHPHICDVYDVGEMPDGSPYLVMQRLVGETLADAILRHHPFPVLLGIQIMIEVLSGLHSAHLSKIVHRDLKPGNIFLASRVGCDPLAKVLDFGLSKMAPRESVVDGSELTSLTRLGTTVGTPFYMAPEQITGGDVDARADIFACGIILYETLTGQKPFRGPSGEPLLRQILMASPRPATSLRPALPPEADLVIARALARDPAARYQQATAFQHDLSALREVIAPRVAKKGLSAPFDVVPSLADSGSNSHISIEVTVSEDSMDGMDSLDSQEPDSADELTTTGAARNMREAAPPIFDLDEVVTSTTVDRFGPVMPNAERALPSPPEAVRRPPPRVRKKRSF